ncbi:coiled-coil domain-containing protein 188 isoform X3 [Ornithorhynchus anatinus]|uniref:coiled-coil domain-containing protein 188 isoform X3 n=1 Tax=Ornithorhynchus anatinus TaxID=9258 RepID=UPI0010A82652|nr:coiled-coil domain-containing protein 188 isoform X3 [Ornithorhynchus anatinus]XP_028905011.1 coiled-coil domain-containing protein 188 isoform X3 [Ornithorhynchus anatinus]XP_028905012.1 coiled-coil domain-containing protein 188 isoform X3 [Ornithorhynchus anatinus]XP_028905013.1 coiled-coil domain-containing protein 188 isoform X3 [Ornithorhynchus anatinus]
MKDSRNSPARDHRRKKVGPPGAVDLPTPGPASSARQRGLWRGRPPGSYCCPIPSGCLQPSAWSVTLGPVPSAHLHGALSATSPAPPQTDLQHLRQEFQGKKEIISEVQAAVSTVQASLAEQSLSVQNLRQGVGEALQEMEALQLTMQAEQTQDQALWPQDRHVSTPAPTPETVLLEMVGQGISALWEKRGGVGRMVRRAQWLGSRLLLLFGVSWTAFYILIVHPALLEGLVPPLLSKGTVWRVRGFFTPFLRLEVDDLLPF